MTTATEPSSGVRSVTMTAEQARILDDVWQELREAPERTRTARSLGRDSIRASASAASNGGTSASCFGSSFAFAALSAMGSLERETRWLDELRELADELDAKYPETPFEQQPRPTLVLIRGGRDDA